VPNLPEVGAYAGMANLMRVPPETAAAALQNTAASGLMGPEVAAAVRSALSGITTTSGNPLDASTINSAMNSLQQAASAMVSAVHTSASSANPTGTTAPNNGGQGEGTSPGSIQVNVATSFGRAPVSGGEGSGTSSHATSPLVSSAAGEGNI
jgi:hypothetical protein